MTKLQAAIFFEEIGMEVFKACQQSIQVSDSRQYSCPINVYNNTLHRNIRTI